MDAKEGLKGQLVNFNCPTCGETLEIKAHVIFEANEIVTCPQCGADIHLENSRALNKLEKQWKGLKKWTNS